MTSIDIEWRSPVRAFSPLEGAPWAHLLHGGAQADASRWSFIVAHPARRILARGSAVYIDGERTSDDIFTVLDAAVRERAIAAADTDHPPFRAGLVGFIGYEAAAAIEPSLALPPSPFSLPDVAVGFYDAAAVFDREQRKAYVTGVDEGACTALFETLSAGAPKRRTPPASLWREQSNFTREDYLAAVTSVINDIRDGRIFQANIAQQLSAACESDVSALAMFEKIVDQSDAAFSALLQFEGASVLSNSPERFFRVAPDGGERRITTEPIKGTRPRGATPEVDEALAQELRDDPKDRAENVMIADLMRNDLSKICKDGSIREEAICALLSLTRVHHLVSIVSGALQPGIGVGDVFRALFPCGSITGAPKIEAMKVIAGVEEIGRGPYCGAFGYWDDRGVADFSVAIRTMVLEKRSSGHCATYPVGGGVTLRSSPALEYDETLVKARGLKVAFADATESGAP